MKIRSSLIVCLVALSGLSVHAQVHHYSFTAQVSSLAPNANPEFTIGEAVNGSFSIDSRVVGSVPNVVSYHQGMNLTVHFAGLNYFVDNFGVDAISNSFDFYALDTSINSISAGGIIRSPLSGPTYQGFSPEYMPFRIDFDSRFNLVSGSFLTATVDLSSSLENYVGIRYNTDDSTTAVARLTSITHESTTAIPEPGAAGAFLGLGALSFGLMRRKR